MPLFRRLRPGDTYAADEADPVAQSDLDGPEPDLNPPPESEQAGPVEGEGGPSDGGN